MWYITNNYNTPILKRYNEYVIKSLFELLIELSKRNTIVADLGNQNFLIDEFESNIYLDSRLLSINVSATNKIEPLIKEIILLGTATLEQEYTIYIDQNEYLNNKKYNLVEIQHPAPLKKLFKDYFYDKFWGVDWIWNDIIGQKYNRSKFHSNFKTENELTVCPYCDIDTISQQRNGWVEHFLPKGKFPYIACNPNNLLPACTACNVSGSGKGENTKNPIITPFNTEIGDRVVFNLINGEIEIENAHNTSIENYVELLKLRERYKMPTVANSIFSVLKNNFNLVTQVSSSDDFDKDILIEYLYKTGRNRGFYFVQKNLLGDIEDILKMN